MKLTVSYEEAQKAVRASLNLSYTVNVVISDKPRKPKTPIASKTGDLNKVSQNLFQLISYIDHNVMDSKIACIKAIRQYQFDTIEVGLKEAKDIVENWGAARTAFLRENRRVIPSYEANGKVYFETPF